MECGVRRRIEGWMVAVVVDVDINVDGRGGLSGASECSSTSREEENNN